MNPRFLAVFTLGWLISACATAPEPPPPPAAKLPTPAPQAVNAPTPRAEVARVWVYPPHVTPSPLADQGLRQRLRATLAKHAPFVTVSDIPAVAGSQAGAPDPAQPDGGQTLARQEVHYAINGMLEMGPRGFFTLEERRPPNPIPGWLTSQPVHGPEEVALAMEHTVATLVNHLSRHHRQVFIHFPPAPLMDAPSATASGPWEIQAGAFLVPENAARLLEELKTRGHFPFLSRIIDTQGRTWHAVRLGRHQERASAEAALKQFEQGERMDACLTPAGGF